MELLAPSKSVGWGRLYAAYWRYSEGVRGRIVLSNTLLVLSQIVKLAIPWLAAQAINALQLHGTSNLTTPAYLVAAIFGASVLCWMRHGPGRIIAACLASTASRRRECDASPSNDCGAIGFRAKPVHLTSECGQSCRASCRTAMPQRTARFDRARRICADRMRDRTF